MMPASRTRWTRLRRPLRNVLGGALIILSGMYVYGILDDSFDELARGAYALSVAGWLVLLVGIVGTLILSTAYHVLATRRIEAVELPPTRIAVAYALGQIVRYVPGKIVGVLFQARYLTGSVRASTVGLALIVQTVYDYLWTFAFAGSILLCVTFRTAWPLLALLPTGYVLWQAHVQGWCERGLLLAGPLRRLFEDRQLQRLRAPTYSGAATLVLLAEWIPMLLGIGFALDPMLGWGKALLLGAIYLVAAVGSLLVFVVPSGLVVREALFVWLGVRYGFEPAMLVFVGVALRAAMTLAEALNAAAFVAADALQRRLASSFPPEAR